MNLIRSLFWIALFAGSTFCFIVLFEYGFKDFGVNCKKEVASLKHIFNLAETTKATNDANPR
jgi:hypothetical protein